MKKYKLTRLAAPLSAFCIFLFYSCAPAYIPNTLNTPMLSNEGELNIALNSGVSGFDPQISYALTDHIGLMINGSFDSQTSDSSDNYHRHTFLEAAPGYYTRLGEKFSFEAYAGMGLGNTQGEYSGLWWKSDANARLIRFFFQPSIGITSPYLDAGMATRFVLVNLKQDSYTDTGLFFEPAFTLKAGYKNVKAISQIGLSLAMNSDNIEFEYQPFIFSIGLQFSLWKDD